MNTTIKTKIIAGVLAMGMLMVGAATLVSGRSAQAATENPLDIYLIAGQSNAVGQTVADTAELAKIDERMVNGYENILYYGYTDRYVNASKTAPNDLPALSIQSTKVGLGLRSSAVKYFGPELGMAHYLSLTEPDTTFGLIKYASGSSTIRDDVTSTYNSQKGNWMSPSLIEEYGKNDDVLTGLCYNTFMEIVESGLKAYTDAGYTPVIRGVAWMQGESEAGSAEWSAKYSHLLSSLISDMRRDLTEISGQDCSELAFVVAKIPSGYAVTNKYANVVREQQQAVADADLDVYTIDNDFCTLPGTDAHHYNQADMLQVGSNFAEALLHASQDESGKVVFRTSSGGASTIGSVSAEEGETVATVLVPSYGYEFSSVGFTDREGNVLDIEYTLTGNRLSFAKPAQTVLVDVRFALIPRFTIEITADDAYGEVYRTNASRNPYRGESVTFTFAPAAGYEVESVSVNGEKVTLNTSRLYPTYTLTVVGDVTVNVNFVAAETTNPAVPQTPVEPPKSDGGGLSAGAVAGIVCAGVTAVAVGTSTFVVVRKKKRG